MGECAILTALIDTEIPNYSRQKDNRTFHEKVTLLAYPTAIKVKHNRVAGFIGIRNVRHEAGVYRVTSVALAWVVKIDNVKFRFHLVTVQVAKQMIVSDFRKVREFVIITIEWKSHATLTLLATQDLPTFGYNMIDPLKSWCWGSILFYPFKISRFS